MRKAITIFLLTITSSLIFCTPPPEGENGWARNDNTNSEWLYINFYQFCVGSDIMISFKDCTENGGSVAFSVRPELMDTEEKAKTFMASLINAINMNYKVRVWISADHKIYSFSVLNN
jgi:hypothetical protein